mmetsp:Transcript_44084/g.82417  ORF Transcript_44084/g.82417 Transcript_44084/m.82417 type:complete len:152 (-) Transcript_44084:209-664(-)
MFRGEQYALHRGLRHLNTHNMDHKEDNNSNLRLNHSCIHIWYSYHNNSAYMTEFKAIETFTLSETDPCSQQDLQLLPQHLHEEYILKYKVWVKEENVQIKLRKTFESATKYTHLTDEQFLSVCCAIQGGLGDGSHEPNNCIHMHEFIEKGR